MKQVLISILIAAGTAFLTTLFQGLLDFLKGHASEIVAGTTASAAYLAKYYKV